MYVLVPLIRTITYVHTGHAHTKLLLTALICRVVVRFKDAALLKNSPGVLLTIDDNR